MQIEYAGASFKEGQSRRNRFTPCFPGNEIAGTIFKIGENIPNCNYSVGDRVLIVPDEDETDGGYAEYIAVNDTSRVIQIPNNIPGEVGAMLPGGALQAYAAVNTAKPYVEKLQKVKRKCFMKSSIFFSAVLCSSKYLFVHKGERSVKNTGLKDP